jgi:hypothetical protein
MRVSLNGNRNGQQQEEENAETTHNLNVTCPRLRRKLYIQGPAASYCPPCPGDPATQDPSALPDAP